LGGKGRTILTTARCARLGVIWFIAKAASDPTWSVGILAQDTCRKAWPMVRIAALAVTPLLLYAPSALAWGGLAHETICEIAFLELNEVARQQVIELIQQDEEFRLFRASCNWPDRPRRRAPEHFVNLPRDATELGDDECPLAEKCAVTAIEDDFAVLASSDATDEEKLEALKFLGHWVGDIHQPLHVSFEDDRGGNSVNTQGSSCDNLHAVWDRCIVEERLGMHPVALAGELHAGITDEQRAKWLASDALAWANESAAIAISPDVDYCVMVGGVNWNLTRASPRRTSWSATAIWRRTHRSCGSG
jgi:S1/P1 Nuclease